MLDVLYQKFNRKNLFLEKWVINTEKKVLKIFKKIFVPSMKDVGLLKNIYDIDVNYTNEYLKRNEVVFIDYLLVDYIIFLAYLNFESVKKDIDFIPNNNINFGWLFHVMNKVFDPEECKKYFCGETFTYKLSWKIKWKRNLKNKKTFYGAFLDGELDDKCYTT